MKTVVCECDIGMGLEWSGNETHQEARVVRWRNWSIKLRIPSASSGKFWKVLEKHLRERRYHFDDQLNSVTTKLT